MHQKIKIYKMILSGTLLLLMFNSSCDKAMTPLDQSNDNPSTQIINSSCPRNDLHPCHYNDNYEYARAIKDELNAVLDCEFGPYPYGFPSYCQFSALWANPTTNEPIISPLHTVWKFCSFTSCDAWYGCEINGELRYLSPVMEEYAQDLVLDYAKDWAIDNDPFKNSELCVCSNSSYYYIRFYAHIIPSRLGWTNCYENEPDLCYNGEILFRVYYYCCCEPTE